MNQAHNALIGYVTNHADTNLACALEEIESRMIKYASFDTERRIFWISRFISGCQRAGMFMPISNSITYCTISASAIFRNLHLYLQLFFECPILIYYIRRVFRERASTNSIHFLCPLKSAMAACNTCQLILAVCRSGAKCCMACCLGCM